MSKQFVKGNVYVFSSKKCKPTQIMTWPNKINGNKVTITSKYSGEIGIFGLVPQWCKCIKNNNPKIESEEI